MSANFNGIDLNADVPSVDPDGSVNGVSSLESKFETLIAEPSNKDKGAVGVNRIDNARVRGGIWESVLRSDEGGAEMEAVDKTSNPIRNNDQVSRVGSLADENSRTSVVGLSLDRNVQSNIIGHNKVENLSGVGNSQHASEEFNAINLVVELNPCTVSGGEFISSGQGFGNSGARMNVSSGGMDISFAAALGNNSGFGTDGVGLNEKLDTLSKEEVEDAEHWKLANEKTGNGFQTEKEGGYKVSDLVWGKVKSHPWWPGQIFDPSASSKKARKHFKKDSFLIAYFGDQSFAWNDALQIKPFQMYFSQMEKQTNMETFCHAVDCALDEVSRRVEFGLACSCLSEMLYSKIKSQVIVNAGIRKESSRTDGGDKVSGVDSFTPAKAVQYVKAVAQCPLHEMDRLEYVTVRAQLLAFNRWKGYYQLPQHKILHKSAENNVDVSVSGEEKVIEDSVPASESKQVLALNGKSISGDSSSRKRKGISTDAACPSRKNRCLSDLMSGDCSSVPNGENRSDKSGSKMSSFSSAKKRKVAESFNDLMAKSGTADKVSLTSSRKKLFGVPVLKNDDGSFKRAVSGSGGKAAQACLHAPAVYTPLNEILSQLCLAAIDPMKEQSFLMTVIPFLSDFRNYCVESCNLRNDKKSTIKASDKQTVSNSPKSETTEASGLKGIEDSYWTDRIIQSNPEEQILFEPDTAILDSSPKSNHEPEMAVGNLESDAEKPRGLLDDSCKEYSATALILKFNNKDAVPSETNLNKIFSRYGPLKELETEVLKKRNCAKVVFKRRSDAETAFSSAGKFSIFGPSLVSYRLDYSPTPRKTSTPGRKQNKTDVTSVKVMQFED